MRAEGLFVSCARTAFGTDAGRVAGQVVPAHLAMAGRDAAARDDEANHSANETVDARVRGNQKLKPSSAVGEDAAEDPSAAECRGYYGTRPCWNGQEARDLRRQP